MGNTTTRITKSLRFEILKRDGHKCRYCGAEATDTKLQVDHVVPIALGGQNIPENLVAACIDCNSGKGSNPPDAQTVAQLSEAAREYERVYQRVVEERREQALERIEQRHEEQQRQAGYCKDFRWSWGTYFDEDDLPYGWKHTLIRFEKEGITFHELDEACKIAYKAEPRDPFRYFCAIIWGEITKRQEITAAIIAGGE